MKNTRKDFSPAGRDSPPAARGVYPAGTWGVSGGTWGLSPGDIDGAHVIKRCDNNYSCESK
jgi:hypothetical protein